MDTTTTTKQTERLYDDPRDRLLTGRIADFIAATVAVEAGARAETRELYDAYSRDYQAPPADAVLRWTERIEAAQEARWIYQKALAALLPLVVRDLTDAGLFQYAEALERGDMTRLGW